MDEGVAVTALDVRHALASFYGVSKLGPVAGDYEHGRPRALLLSIRDYLRLAVPEPEVLRMIGKESRQEGTNKMADAQIDRIMKAARQSKSR